MFEIAYAKAWMVKTIRDLFRLRPVQLKPSMWACVVRNGQIMVVHRYYKQPGDYEVMWCFLRPGQIPSWFKTNMAIRRHWSVLKNIALEGFQQIRNEYPQDSSGQVRFGT